MLLLLTGIHPAKTLNFFFYDATIGEMSEIPSLGQNKKESSYDNKQLYNWGKIKPRSEPLY